MFYFTVVQPFMNLPIFFSRRIFGHRILMSSWIRSSMKVGNWKVSQILRQIHALIVDSVAKIKMCKYKYTNQKTQFENNFFYYKFSSEFEDHIPICEDDEVLSSAMSSPGPSVSEVGMKSSPLHYDSGSSPNRSEILYTEPQNKPIISKFSFSSNLHHSH